MILELKVNRMLHRYITGSLPYGKTDKSLKYSHHKIFNRKTQVSKNYKVNYSTLTSHTMDRN